MEESLIEALASSASPSERHRVADHIFHELRQQIVSGTLPLGSRLPTEKVLAARYGVSIPTVREAIRGLAVIDFIEVRHGSGAYVSANGESLVAMSLGAVIQLRSVNATQALGLLSVLSEHAAVSAVTHATPTDLRRLREAAEVLAEAPAGTIAGAVRAFHHALVRAAHNPLLEVIYTFLVDVQIEFAREVAGGSVAVWKSILDELQQDRLQIVEALERRDAKAATVRSRAFGERVIRVVTSLPGTKEVRLVDPRLGAVLSAVVSRMDRPA